MRHERASAAGMSQYQNSGPPATSGFVEGSGRKQLSVADCEHRNEYKEGHPPSKIRSAGPSGLHRPPQ